MILIADSGSTKCSWALCDEQENIILKCDTIGKAGIDMVISYRTVRSTKKNLNANFERID